MVVARTAHRDNKSDYYIDDRKSTFTGVTALLKGKGIDLDNNRFLILQVCLSLLLEPVCRSPCSTVPATEQQGLAFFWESREGDSSPYNTNFDARPC